MSRTNAGLVRGENDRLEIHGCVDQQGKATKIEEDNLVFRHEPYSVRFGNIV